MSESTLAKQKAFQGYLKIAANCGVQKMQATGIHWAASTNENEKEGRTV